MWKLHVTFLIIASCCRYSDGQGNEYRKKKLCDIRIWHISLMENVISHKVDEMTPKQISVLENINRLVEITTEEKALMPCSLLETYSSIILPGINMGLLLTENDHEEFEEKTDQSRQKKADFSVRAHHEKQEISKEKLLHQAINCKDSCIKPRSAADYFKEQLFVLKSKSCKNNLSKQEPHNDIKSNIIREKKSKLKETIHEDDGGVDPDNEEPHIYYADQVPMDYQISAEESFVESSDEFSNIPSDDSVSSDDESYKYLGTEDSYYEYQNVDGGDNDSDGINDEGTPFVTDSSNEFNNIPPNDEETDNAKATMYQGRVKDKSHTDKQRNQNTQFLYHSDSAEKKYSSEKTCKHICRYISLITSGYRIIDFQMLNFNIDGICLLEEEMTSEHIAINVHKGFGDLDDNNKSKDVYKDRIPQKNVSYAAHKRQTNTDDKDMESTDKVSSLKPQMGELSSNISLSTNDHENANYVHNMDYEEPDRDRTRPNQRPSPQSTELRNNVKASGTSNQDMADNNHYDKSGPEILNHDKRVNYVNDNHIETPKQPDRITRLLESKESEHNAKFQNLELMIVKLENKLLKKSLEEKDNSHVMQNLENHVLKIENELVKLNQTYQQLQHEHEILKSKQNNLLFPMQMNTTPRRSNYLALDAKSSNELMTQQKQKIEKLSQLVHDQSQDFLMLKSKYQQMEKDNKQLFQIMMNQTALISNVMMQINEMKENNIKERMKNQKLNLKTQAHQEDKRKNLHPLHSQSFENSKSTVTNPPDLLIRLLLILKPQTFLKSIMEIVKLQTRMNIPCPSICLYHKVIVSSATPFSFLQWQRCKTMSGTYAYKPRTSVDSFSDRSRINNSESDNLHHKSEHDRVNILSGDIHNFKETNRNIRSDDLNTNSNAVTGAEGEDESDRKEGKFETTGNDKNSDIEQTTPEREFQTSELSRNDDIIFFPVEEKEEDNEDRPWAVKDTNYVHESDIELGMESQNNNDENKENDDDENEENDDDENEENDDENEENDDDDEDKENDDDEDKENEDIEDKEIDDDEGKENDDDEDIENDNGNQNKRDYIYEEDVIKETEDTNKENMGNKVNEINRDDSVDIEQDQERRDGARTYDGERYAKKAEINSNKMDMEGDGEFTEGHINESDNSGESNDNKVDQENEEGELIGNDDARKEIKSAIFDEENTPLTEEGNYRDGNEEIDGYANSVHFEEDDNFDSSSSDKTLNNKNIKRFSTEQINENSNHEGANKEFVHTNYDNNKEKEEKPGPSANGNLESSKQEDSDSKPSTVLSSSNNRESDRFLHSHPKFTDISEVNGKIQVQTIDDKSLEPYLHKQKADAKEIPKRMKNDESLVESEIEATVSNSHKLDSKSDDILSENQEIEKDTLLMGRDNGNHENIGADESQKDGAKKASVTNHDVQLSETDSKQDVETTKKTAVNEKESQLRGQSHTEADLVKDTKKAKLEAKRRTEALQRPLLYKPEDTDNRPTDCYSLYKQAGKTSNGLYRIFVHGLNTNVSVMCEMQTGGWTVLLQRNDGSVDFYRNFHQYREGFGIPSSEHYIGNEVIHYFTNQKRYTLKVTLTNWEGETTFALYDHFWIDSEDNDFRLHLQGFSGTAGDGLGKHNGMKFSTYDVDNDLLKTEMGGSCAKRFKGAGWYYKCYMSNLMGVYYNNAVIPEKQFDGITWKPWLGPNYSMKKVVMSVRPLNRE